MRNVSHLLIRNQYESPKAGQFLSQEVREELEAKYGLIHQDYRCEGKCLVQGEEPPPGMTARELAIIARGIEELRIRQAREDPNAFIEYIFEDKDGNPIEQAWFHREWHDAMSRFDRCLIVAPRNHGKCLAEGTPVTLGDGSRVPIECFNGGKVWSLDSASLQWKISDSPKAIPNGMKDVYRVRLRSGRWIDATENHRFLRSVGWARVDELQTGQRLAIPLELPISGKPMAGDEALAIGFMCGDGGMTSRFRFSSSDDVTSKIFTDLFLSRGWKTKRIPGTIDYSVSYHKGARSGGPTHWAKKYEINKTSHKKRAPERIFKGSKGDAFDFAFGYFLADSNVNNSKDPSLEYYSVNRGLLSDAQELLARCGIHGTITEKPSKGFGKKIQAWRFTVRGDNFRKFCELVDKERFGECEKVKQLFDALEYLPDGGNGKHLDCFESEGLLLPEWEKRKYKAITKNKLERLAKKDKAAKRLLEGNVFWDEVVSVEYLGKVQTWDLTVPGDACFIANGIVSHNTTQLVGRIIWELGRNPNLRIKIVCASDSKAVERLFEIQQHIEFNERVHKVFPDLIAADKGDWTKHKIVVKRRARHRDASVEALGITSTATGGRADLLVADDVVDRRNALAMPALREAVRHAWFSDWANLLEPDARVFYICTLWHKNDLSHHLLQNSEYTTLAYAVDDKFASLWPEMWPQVRLLQRKREIGSVEFSRAFRNIAQDESEAPVDHEWIRYFNPKLISPRDLVFFLSYDLATGENVGNDFTACVLFAVDTVRNIIYVVDAWHAKIKAPEQYRRVVRETRKYKCEATLVEAVQYQVSLVQMVNENFPTLPVVPIKPKGSKRARLERSTPYMENGCVMFSSHLDPDRMKRPERGDIIGQLLDFPIAINDDMVDAFSQGVRYIVDNYLDFAEEEDDADAGNGSVSVVGG